MTESSRQRRIGALLSYISLVVNTVVTFIYVPLLLSFLTTEEYGVYELIGSIIAYLSVMDMGLSTTLSRFYVKSKISESKKQTENLLGMAAIIYLVLTVASVALSFLFYGLLGPLFGGSFSEGELELAHQMMLLVILNCVIVLPGNWFLAVINANERFIFARSLSILKYSSQVITTLLVLNIHSSALLVLLVQVFFNAVVVGLYAWYCRVRLRVRCRIHGWDWRLLMALLSFSFFILLNMVFDQVFWKTGQIVLGAVSGAVAVAIYGIACKIITSAYMQLASSVSSVFLPQLTAIATRTEEMDDIDDIFCKVGRLQAILVWGVIAAFTVLGSLFIELWAGPSFSLAYPATLILMFGLSISLTQNVGILILQAKNRMAFRSIVYVGLAVLDLIISIPVSAKYGVIGCALVASALLLIGTGPIMNWYYSRRIGLNISRFYREVTPLIIPAVISAGTTAVFIAVIKLDPSWLAFTVQGIFFAAVYFIILWLFGFNTYEKGIIVSALHRLRRSES